MKVWAWMLGIIATVTIASAPVDKSTTQKIFDDACRLSRYECNIWTPPPVVRVSPQLSDMKLFGMYTGGRVVWAADNLSIERIKLTVFHESIHYLQFEVGGVNTDMMNRFGQCAIEREAMELTNQYADEMGWPKLKRNLESWKKTYGC